VSDTDEVPAEVEISSDMRHLAAAVGARANLQAVALQSLHWDVNFGATGPATTAPANVNVNTVVAGVRNEEQLAYSVTLTVDTVVEGGETLFHADAVFLLGYVVPADMETPQEAIDAFGVVSAAFSAYPFGRELIQSLTARAGLPTLTLDVMRSPIDD
jgi:preprotein translocase subunit SecB